MFRPDPRETNYGDYLMGLTQGTAPVTEEQFTRQEKRAVRKAERKKKRTQYAAKQREEKEKPLSPLEVAAQEKKQFGKEKRRANVLAAIADIEAERDKNINQHAKILGFLQEKAATQA